MNYYKIVKNGKDIVNALTFEEAKDKFLLIIADRSTAVYDNEAGNIYHETTNKVLAMNGDTWAKVGDDEFEILEEEETPAS